MSSISRRSFVKGVAALPLAIGVSRSAWAVDPVMRCDIATPQGQEMLAIFAAAVAKMQSKYTDDSPLGWRWQWYTHFVSGSTTKAAEIERIFGSATTARRRLAEETWDTCQSHSGQDPNNFLPWHRMYVYYLERIVRRVSGRADFTLPYWNYTSDDPAKRGVVPVEFRSPGDPVFGSLYRAERNDLANSGEPIQKYQPGDPMRISGPMGKQNYDIVGSNVGFCRALNSGIHGNIHVLLGNRFGMGNVPYAGNDPLFWVHHANIDRLWESWSRNGGINPVDAPWAQNICVFADANGRAAAPMNSFFNCANLGYEYDAYIPPVAGQPIAAPTAAVATRTTGASIHSERVAKATSSAELGVKPIHAKLLPVSGELRNDVVLGLDPARPDKRTYLVMRGLHTWVQPEVLFHVYVSPTHGGRLDNASYVGAINFFDAQFHDHGHGVMGDALAQNLISFDVTELLHAIGRRGSHDAHQELLVTFAPGGTPTAGARPLVGSIELVRQ